MKNIKTDKVVLRICKIFQKKYLDERHYKIIRHWSSIILFSRNFFEQDSLSIHHFKSVQWKSEKRKTWRETTYSVITRYLEEILEPYQFVLKNIYKKIRRPRPRSTDESEDSDIETTLITYRRLNDGFITVHLKVSKK